MACLGGGALQALCRHRAAVRVSDLATKDPYCILPAGLEEAWC